MAFVRGAACTGQPTLTCAGGSSHGLGQQLLPPGIMRPARCTFCPLSRASSLVAACAQSSAPHPLGLLRRAQRPSTPALPQRGLHAHTREAKQQPRFSALRPRGTLFLVRSGEGSMAAVASPLDAAQPSPRSMTPKDALQDDARAAPRRQQSSQEALFSSGGATMSRTEAMCARYTKVRAQHSSTPDVLQASRWPAGGWEGARAHVGAPWAPCVPRRCAGRAAGPRRLQDGVQGELRCSPRALGGGHAVCSAPAWRAHLITLPPTRARARRPLTRRRASRSRGTRSRSMGTSSR